MIKGEATLLTQEQATAVKKAHFLRINEEQGEKAKKAGDEFLESNKKNGDVKVTGSGLQYIVLRQGTGAKPTAEDKVSVNYRGTLVDGTEFDNSYARGQPAEFPVGGVIPGWTEALQLMNVGAKYKLFVPSALAYGERRMGAKIPPNSTLIFEVELLNILKDSTAAGKPDPLKGLRKRGE
jgi:FKBP-type peptidyl-prolyl cis-trans isomerase